LEIEELAAAKKEAAAARVRMGLCDGVKMSLHPLVLPKVRRNRDDLGTFTRFGEAGRAAAGRSDNLAQCQTVHFPLSII
jgi:hypothetical protein